VEGLYPKNMYMALVGIITIEEYMTLWFIIFSSKTNSPSILTRTGRISKPELYHTPQQLSQYDFPI
jgi:hypothetical protein